MKRDRFQCTYCGAPGTDAELEIDHIIAVARGGSHHISNLTTACRACNSSKGAGDAKALRRPVGREGSGLVGMWLWKLEPDDDESRWRGGIVPPGWSISRQGCVIGLHEQSALVQLYSYMDGGPTNVIAIALDDVLSERCLLFRDNTAMLERYERYAEDERDQYERARDREELARKMAKS